MKINVGRRYLEILQGDITEQEVDAIVNAANNHLWMGARVAGALKRKGGEEIEQAAVALGPIEIGSAVITPGGNLKSSFVIHAAVMGQDLQTDETKIKNATRARLELADEKKLTSLAFPALGTGVGGFSIHHCAEIMITEVLEFLQKARSLQLVRLVLFDQSKTDVFNEILHNKFKAP